MRGICKVFSLTLLRRSIIVHKLEILPKLQLPFIVSTTPTHKPKKADSKRGKTEPFMGCLIH